MIDVRRDTMVDTVEEASKDLKAWVVKVRQGQAPAFLERILNPATESGAQVLVMRSDMVFGLNHIRSALYHAKRAIAERRNSSESLSMETLLYASGERQLSSAIKKMSVDRTTEEVVVARLSGGSIEVDGSWLVLADSAKDRLLDRLMRFGISQQELDTTGRGDPIELVLERVAAVDIIKK
jgi:KEOPS complex subunit Cgi121